MSQKQKTIPVILPSGREATIAVPKRATEPVGTHLCDYLGRWGEWGLYETMNLQMVVVKLEIKSIVKGIGPGLLKTMIDTTDLTPEKAVELGMAEFITQLPEEGWIVADRNVHKWVETLPEETQTKAETSSTAEEVNGDDLM